MNPGKRSKNFTEREKMLLIEVAKEFVAIIDNKKTDGATVDAKKQAWRKLARKYNCESETGPRTEKQLHALYDNLKKKARRNISDDKSETYKTGGGTFCPKTTEVDEKIMALLTPQSEPLSNKFDSSAPYHKLQNETQATIEDPNYALPGTSKDYHDAPKDEVENEVENEVVQIPFSPKIIEHLTRSISPDVPVPTIHKAQPKKKNRSLHSINAIIKRKKQTNDDAITAKMLEILEVQRQQEIMKLEKIKSLLDLDIELKKIQLENAKMDLEYKRNNFNL